MKKIKFFGLALFTIASISSCNIDENPTINNDENKIEDIESITQKYVLAHENMFKAFMRESKRTIESDGNLTEFCENFKETYLSKLATKEEKQLLNKKQVALTRNPEGLSTLIPDIWMAKFTDVLFNENVGLLREKINQFYSDSFFINLNPTEQLGLRIQLETLEKYRDEMINMLIEAYKNENILTRMSPGDRMIWVECSHTMPEEYRKMTFQTCMALWGFLPITGISTITGAAGIASLLYDWFELIF